MVTDVESGSWADEGGTRLRASMAAALKDAMRARDVVAASALRTALSALANAEAVAVDTQASRGVGSRHFAGAVAGLGAGEAARRQLSATDVRAIIQAEIAEREEAARDYAASGLSSQAERLRAEARVLTSAIVAADLDS